MMDRRRDIIRRTPAHRPTSLHRRYRPEIYTFGHEGYPIIGYDRHYNHQYGSRNSRRVHYSETPIYKLANPDFKRQNQAKKNDLPSSSQKQKNSPSSTTRRGEKRTSTEREKQEETKKNKGRGKASEGSEVEKTDRYRHKSSRDSDSKTTSKN